MILYTPFTESEIFPTSDDDFDNRCCVSHNGKMLYVEETSNGTYQLLQLLSTDPNDFMDTTFTPGTTFRG